MQIVVINTWFRKELMHGIARGFTLFMLSDIVQIFIMHKSFS